MSTGRWWASAHLRPTRGDERKMGRGSLVEYIRKQCLSQFILDAVYAFLALRADLYCNALPTQMQLNGTTDAEVLKTNGFITFRADLSCQLKCNSTGTQTQKCSKNQWILNLQGGFELQLIANSNPTQRELKRKSIEKLMVFQHSRRI